RLDVQPAPEMPEQDRLDRQDADARTVRGRVGERDGILDQAAEQPSRQTLVDRTEGRADLPGSLAGAAAGGCREDEDRSDSHDEAAVLAEPRDDGEIEELHVAE